MNDYESFEQDDLFNDEMIEKISALIAHIKQNIGTSVDPHQPEVHDMITKEIVAFANQNHIVRQQQVQEIKTAVMQQLVFDLLPAQGELTQQVKEERITMDEMKKIVQPNVHSAVANYMQFVRPLDKAVVGLGQYDQEKFEKEFVMFRERQMAYLVEDLGSKIQRRDLSMAFDALMAHVSAAVAQKEQEARKENNAVKLRQKMAVIRRVEHVMRDYQLLDRSDHHAVEDFWQHIATDIEKKDGLTGNDLSKTMHVFRNNLQQLYDIVVRAKEKEKKQKVTEMQKGGDSEDASISLTSEQGTDPMEAAKEKSDHLDMSRLQLDNARRVYAEKAIAHNDASSRVRGYFGGTTVLDDADVRVFHADYSKAWQEYRTAYAEEVGASTHGTHQYEWQKMMEMQERMAFFDAKTDVRAEKCGGKIARIVQNISAHFGRFSKKLKSIFVGALIVGGGIIAGTSNQHTADQVVRSPDHAAAIIHVGDNVSQSDEMAQVHAYQQSFKASIDEVQAAIAQKQIDEQKIVSQSETLSHTPHTISVEKGGSIIGALTAYLQANTSLLENTGKTAADMAFVLAQKYGEAHQWIDLNKVYPHTMIHLDATEKEVDGKKVTEMHIKDISLVGGPHIVPEKAKKMIEQEVTGQSVERSSQEHNAPELQSIKELLKNPEFNKAVAGKIADTFGVSRIAELKKIACEPLRSFFRFDAQMTPEERTKRETVQQCLNDIIIKAQEMYGDAGMPRDHATVQAYFIRLYAKAQRDGVIEKIFSA